MDRYEARKAEIGRRIHSERQRLGLTQQELLGRILCSESSQKSLRTWEQGQVLPSLDNLVRMAEVFKCDLGYLLCDYDQRTRELADVHQVTGLDENVIALLSALHSSPADYANLVPFTVINELLGSDLFWDKIIDALHHIFLLRCPRIAEISPENESKMRQAVNTIRLLNLGGYTKYTVTSEELSVEENMRFAIEGCRQIFTKAIEKAVEKEMRQREQESSLQRDS